MTGIAASAASTPTAAREQRGRATPELRRALANIRVIVAIVAATEALTLPHTSSGWTTLAVLGYAAFAGVLCWLELNGQQQASSRLTAWADALWLLLLVWLAASDSGLFILLLLFPILFASLIFGFWSGLLMSLFAAGVSAAEVALYQLSHAHGLSLGLMTPSITLLMLGPLLAGLARGGLQMSAQQTITDRLLAEVDPRLGLKRATERLMTVLQRYFDADSALMLIWLPDCPPRLFRLLAEGHTVTEPEGALHTTLMEALTHLPADIAAAHHLVHALPTVPLRYHGGLHLETREPSAAARSLVEDLAEQLEARSLLAIPICRRSPHPSRLVLVSRTRSYRTRDAALLHAVMDQIAPVLENASLLEQLTEEAMATERARIGRDLHDKAIQPYLGLKYGVEALARKASPDNPLYRDIRSLEEIVIDELHQLRETVSGMRNGGSSGDAAIGPVLQRQAHRFSELFGIQVEVDCPTGLVLGRRLTGELVPLVSEALTNIRRHTGATQAQIAFREDAAQYILRISNPHPTETPPPPFTPRSIHERAEFLQGCAVVDLLRPGFTDLIVNIPKHS